MVYVSPEKKQLPASGDNYNYIDEQRAFAASVRDIVSVANRAEADGIVAAMAADGRAVTDANLLFVFNNETKNVEIRDSSGWRPMVSTPPMGHMGCTTGFQYVNTGLVIDFAAAQLLRGGITFNTTTNALVLPYTGLYRFSARILFSSGQSGYTNYAQIRKNTVATGIFMEEYKPTVRDHVGYLHGIMPCSANDSISLFIETDNDNASANTWGTDGYNGTFLEVEMIGV